MFPLLFQGKGIGFKRDFFFVLWGNQAFRELILNKGSSPLFNLNLNSFLPVSGFFAAKPCFCRDVWVAWVFFFSLWPGAGSWKLSLPSLAAVEQRGRRAILSGGGPNESGEDLRDYGLFRAWLAVMLPTCVHRWSGKPWVLYESWKHLDLLGGVTGGRVFTWTSSQSTDCFIRAHLAGHSFRRECQIGSNCPMNMPSCL